MEVRLQHTSRRAVSISTRAMEAMEVAMEARLQRPFRRAGSISTRPNRLRSTLVEEPRRRALAPHSSSEEERRLTRRWLRCRCSVSYRSFCNVEFCIHENHPIIFVFDSTFPITFFLTSPQELIF